MEFGKNLTEPRPSGSGGSKQGIIATFDSSECLKTQVRIEILKERKAYERFLVTATSYSEPRSLTVAARLETAGNSDKISKIVNFAKAKPATLDWIFEDGRVLDD